MKNWSNWWKIDEIDEKSMKLIDDLWLNFDLSKTDQMGAKLINWSKNKSNWSKKVIKLIKLMNQSNEKMNETKLEPVKISN